MLGRRMSISRSHSAHQRGRQAPTTGTGGIKPQVLSILLAFGLPITYMLLLFIEATRYIWRPISMLLYIAAIVAVLFSLVCVFIASDMAKEKRRRYLPFFTERETILAVLIVCAVALTVSFSQFCKHLWVYFGGFEAEGLGYWHWLRFGIDGVLGSFAVGILHNYQIHVTEISPTGFLMQTLSFGFNVIWTFLILTSLLRIIKGAGMDKAEAARIRQSRRESALSTRIFVVVMLAMWVIPTVVFAVALMRDGFFMDSTMSMMGYVLPVIAGGWFVGEGLRGIAVWPKPSHRVLSAMLLLLGAMLLAGGFPTLGEFLRSLRQ